MLIEPLHVQKNSTVWIHADRTTKWLEKQHYLDTYWKNNYMVRKTAVWIHVDRAITWSTQMEGETNVWYMLLEPLHEARRWKTALFGYMFIQQLHEAHRWETSTVLIHANRTTTRLENILFEYMLTEKLRGWKRSLLQTVLIEQLHVWKRALSELVLIERLTEASGWN